MKESQPMFDFPMLKQLCIWTMGETLAILRLAKKPTVLSLPLTGYPRVPAAKLIQLSKKMIELLRKLIIDWDIFTKMMNPSLIQVSTQLYKCWDREPRVFWY